MAPPGSGTAVAHVARLHRAQLKLVVGLVLLGSAAAAAAAAAGWSWIPWRRRRRATVSSSSSGTGSVVVVHSVEELASVCSSSSGSRTERLSAVHDVRLTGVGPSVSITIADAALCLARLQSLDLSNNSLTDFPLAVLSLTHLKKLTLSRNKLRDLPEGIDTLAQLEDLDVGRNELEVLPDSLGRLSRLRTLNVMANQLHVLPESIGGLSNVFRLGLKSNRLRSLPESMGDMSSLVELFVTDNELTSLPRSMGRLHNLVKFQASFNKLESLPEELGQLPRLELFRVAVNHIREVPDSFAGMDSLAWFSLAGNPACAAPPDPHPAIAEISVSALRLGDKLGDGASGDVYAATMEGRAPDDVVLKAFKAETSPDGHARDEMAIACALDHPHISRVVATVEPWDASDDCAGIGPSKSGGLVLQRMHAKSMADKPNFESLLRCRWAAGTTFSLPYVLSVSRGVASALSYLHGKGVCHGDVYAHNIMATDDGHATLCDFGASFCYDRASAVPYEAHEVRAFGLFLNDLHKRIAMAPSPQQAAAADEIGRIVDLCVNSPARSRIRFDDVVSKLDAVQA